MTTILGRVYFEGCRWSIALQAPGWHASKTDVREESRKNNFLLAMEKDELK